MSETATSTTAVSSVRYPFPKDITLEAVELLAMIRGVKPKDIPTAVNCGWAIIGFGAGVALGDPSPSGVVSASSATSLTDKQAIGILEALSKGHGEHEMRAAGVLDGILPVGVGKGAILKLLLPALGKWLQDWLNGGGLDHLIGNLAT